MLQFFQRLENPDAKFHLYDSYYRIKKIEKVCLKENVDGLLIINGIDSKENYEYTKLMNWVFLGHSGIEIETNEYLDNTLSETIFVITKDHMRAYCDQQGFRQLKPYLLQMPNLKLFVPTIKEDENKDESEVLKMAQFVKMMQGLKRIGVLLPQEKNRNIEKWPIIQGYGLLGNGFFSMQHEIVNMTERINQLYKPHDKHSMKTLINVVSQRLNGHVSGSVQLLSEIAIKKRPAVTSEQMVEIFLDTFEIEENKYVKRSNKLTPTVTFGNCSSQEKLPLHLTMESSDLYSSLRFSRTYFLTKQVSKENVIIPIHDDFEHFVKEYQYQIIEHSYHKDECLLIEIYKALIESFYSALQMICQDYRKMTNQLIFELSQERLTATLANYKLQFLNDNLIVTVTSYNAFGEEVAINFKDPISFKLTPQFFSIRLEYRSVPSQVVGGTILGNVIFSDSFILQENCYYIITSNIPHLQIVNTDARFSDDIEKVKKKLPLEKLGQQISEKVDKNRLFLPSKHALLEIPIQIASYILHENGIRIFTNELGWFFILFDQMKKIKFTQGLESVWMIFMTEPILCASLQAKTVALEFVGKSVDQVYMKMINILKENEIKVDYTENPKEFQLTRLGQMILKKEQKVPLLGNIIRESSFLLDYLESKQLVILTQVKSDLKLLNYLSLQDESKQIDDRIGIILITGSYSSGKTKFAQSLQRYATDFNQKAQVLSFSLLEQSILDEEGWLNKLENQLKYSQEQCICVVPFYLSVDIIVQQLSNGKLSKFVYIKNVVNKININNIYQNENCQPIENLVSQSLPGYCQFTILDSFGNEESEVEEYFKIFRTVCLKSNIYRITNNMIQSSVAKEIYSCTSYNSTQNAFLRSKLASYKSQTTTYQKVFIHNAIPCVKQFRKILRELFKTSQSQKAQASNYEKLSEIDKFIFRVKEFNSPQKPSLSYLKAFLRFEGQLDKLYEYTANHNYTVERQVKSVNILLKEQLINGSKLQIPSYVGWDTHSNLGFFMVGQNITKEICQQYIGELIQKMKPLQALLTKNDLSKEIIKEIEFENRIIGLENGEFYDGQFIRNQDGEILEHHPKLDIFIQEYLKIQNQKIIEANNQIQQEWNNYVNALKC
ncbi:unnamed protein product (macronuclear) [Paramecium tetraurelia]|uniref:DAAF9 N-terminal domain-containing protein n=1 Tax=Paramecium tetraurelia TaxID=5888 RepID=A0E8W4_PARTE|nr:uncharacterized protein GSPATT00024462001 [Paramecium tetraurelia]CAK91731.1 unnamed protein product [Paramecium tetraurelia]|eukprot:XP_001459128.1 hypothetical protein (macronuclear) [Paramecium tetraurelia strain d4-2]